VQPAWENAQARSASEWKKLQDLLQRSTLDHDMNFLDEQRSHDPELLWWLTSLDYTKLCVNFSN
jgi:hypothetical protein